MVAKRIIACLDVADGKVVKGVQFTEHRVVGDAIELAQLYAKEGIDELVFYDIKASSRKTCVDANWVKEVARVIDIPFCVAGGITSVEQAKMILRAGADKISINSPALKNPSLVQDLVVNLGQQCVVVGVDSWFDNGDYYVYQYTGSDKTRCQTSWRTLDWCLELQKLGAGEIVLNSMNQDGMRQGFDVAQLSLLRESLNIPLVASGGAGKMADFKDVFEKSGVDAALAASVFHKGSIEIPVLKNYLLNNKIEVRL